MTVKRHLSVIRQTRHMIFVYGQIKKMASLMSKEESRKWQEVHRNTMYVCDRHDMLV